MQISLEEIFILGSSPYSMSKKFPEIGKLFLCEVVNILSSVGSRGKTADIYTAREKFSAVCLEWAVPDGG